MSRFSVEPIAGVMGAELSGVNVAKDLSPGLMEDLGAALWAHQVLVLRDQELTPKQHVEMAKHFGEVEEHTFFHNLGKGQEQVTVLDWERPGDAAVAWHADETFLETPPIINLLHAQTIPDFGGDTLFASTYQAYDQLSPAMQRYVEASSAEHDVAMTMKARVDHGMPFHQEYGAALQQDQRSVHPVVATHPETGRHALNVNPTYTSRLVGVPPDEGRAVLGHLYQHTVSHRMLIRHRWKPGDLVMWDNRCVWHAAVGDTSSKRVVHRVSVLGATRPVFLPND
ncbi:MAG: TauD/TfdA dioxygenase family protein [Myxococcota bacterium]